MGDMGRYVEIGSSHIVISDDIHTMCVGCKNMYVALPHRSIRSCGALLIHTLRVFSDDSVWNWVRNWVAPPRLSSSSIQMVTCTSWLPPAYNQYICTHREIPLLCLSLSASCPFRSHSSHFCHPPVCMHHHLMSGFTTSSPWRRHCATSAGVTDAEHRIRAVLLAQFARCSDSASRPEAAQHILGSGSGFFGHT